MGLILTAYNFNTIALPYFDIKEAEWKVCLKLAKAAGTISQSLVNHLELNATYRVKTAQAHALARGILEALDHHWEQMKLPDDSKFVELPKYEARCRHFSKWAKETSGFALFNASRPRKM